MNLAAVIVHYGNPLATERLIETLRSCPAVDRTVVTLHDSYSLSREGNVEWIEAENRGYAAGLNRAVEHALVTGDDSQLLLALNPDVRIDAKTIEDLITEHRKANADCTFPVIRENNRLIHGYRFSRFGTLKTALNPEWHSGACFLFSAAAWKAAGGFDESYFHYFEDRDFCLRLKSAGLRCHQTTQIVVEHEGKSGADYPASDLPKYAVRNHLIALERSELLGPLSFLNVTARHFVYLFRWKKGWRGISKWRQGIREFVNGSVVK
jgi:N-acetylglucosaminyl-diphospho-decaprenol L-rhamnosyltransferase